MSTVRPDLALLWPSYTLFPLAGLGILVFGASAGDFTMVLIGLLLLAANAAIVVNYGYFTKLAVEGGELVYRTNLDRKSTRLNSSHLVISYAVFCLKKKKIQITFETD